MLFMFCVSLIVGAVGVYSFELPVFGVVALALVCGVATVLVFRTKRSMVLGVALSLSVLAGAYRVAMLSSHSVPLGAQAFTGTVLRVDTRLEKTLVVVHADTTNARVQVSVYGGTGALPGDRVAVRGVVQLPEDFVTETGRTFDYDTYLASRGVDAVVSRAVLTVQPEPFHFQYVLARYATKLRLWIADVLSEYIRFPVDGIVGGMLVGFQGGIPDDVSDVFRRTGTLHTLVLSGYNITVLAGFLGLVLARFHRKARLALTFFGIVALVLISGSGVAAVRAGVMGSIALFAGATLSTYNVFRALLIALLFFFFTSPLSVFVDPGLHLSFLATLFMVLILPVLKTKTTFLERWPSVKEQVLLAVGLPVFMLPYLMYFSGAFPLVSPLANIILAPVIPLLMLGGLAVVAVSWIAPLAGLAGAITSFIGSAVLWVLELCARLPQWQTPAISGWVATGMYAVLFLTLFRKTVRQFFNEYGSLLQ